MDNPRDTTLADTTLADTTFSPEVAEALAAVALMAAFADGQKDRAEKARLEELFAAFGDVNMARLYQRVMLGQTTLGAEGAKLRTPELQSAAFEMALSVCDADGVTNEAEGRFLGQLQAALSVPAERAEAAQRDAEQLAAMPVETPFEPTARSATPEAARAPAEGGEALDRQILNAAILNGALELLPQSLATVAIVPLQMRLVYGIGQAYGYQLDGAHLREFLAVAGVGMSSQVLEGHVRKLFGGFAKRSLGKGAKGVASSAAGAAMSFATTYALGQAAKRYYGGGRTLALSDVRNLFQSQLEQGRGLFEAHQGEVQQKAKTTDLRSLLQLVR